MSGTRIDSIKSGTDDGDLHAEQMTPQNVQDALVREQKPSDSNDPAKDDYSGMIQGRLETIHGTQGDGNTGEKTTTLRLLEQNGLSGFADQPTQPSKDLGRITGYD